MLRVMGFLIGMVSTVGVGFVAAQDSDTELPLPLVTLGVLPARQAIPRAAEIDEDEILSLIDELDGLNTQEIGLLRQPAFGQVFLPVGYFDAFGVRKELYYKPFAPVERLIRIGPPAIPFLLKFLGDDTPTQFVVRPVLGNGGAPDGVSVDEVLHGNPLNWIEQSCGVTRDGYSPSIRDDSSSRHELECYRVKVGDVCFAVLGQIVGRSYDCLSYQHVKDGHIVVCSPVHRRNLRDRVIRIWSTSNPRQRVYESLVLDFATRPVQQGDDPNETSIASDLQVGAAVRLLYYYPVESSGIVAQRLSSLDLSDDIVEAHMRNGVLAEDLIEAVGWSDCEAVVSVVEEMARRAKDKDVVESLKRASTRMPLKSTAENAELESDDAVDDDGTALPLDRR